MSDPQFNAALDHLQKTWEDAESFATWDPPVDGQYPWRFTRVRRSTNNNDNSLQWMLYGDVEDPSNPDVHGKEWRPFFFTSKHMGFIKEFLTSTRGTIPVDVHDADRALDGLVGGLYIVDISTGQDKNGNPRRNCRVLRPVQLPPAEEAA